MYSLDYDQLLNEMDDALEARIEEGSLEPFLPSRLVHVTASAPYQEGRNIYLAAQVTTSEGIQVWDLEKNF